MEREVNPMTDTVTRSELVAALEAAANKADALCTSSVAHGRASVSAAALDFAADALRRPANPLDDENANLRHSLGFAEAAHALASKHRDEAIAERDALRAKLEAMAAREPTGAETKAMADALGAGVELAYWVRGWKAVRDQVLATEATAQADTRCPVCRVEEGALHADNCPVLHGTVPPDAVTVPAPTPAPALRPEVLAFAQRMEAKLAQHDAERGKCGWRGCSLPWLHMRASDELSELGTAIADGDESRIADEAADVGNFAMMIADIVGQVAPTPAPAEASEDVERDTLISRVLDRWDNCQPIADAMNALSRYERARRGEGAK